MSFSNLALSGGALRGLSYIGVIRAFEELNILKYFKNIIGTSVGSFFGLMIALGYTSKQLEKLFMRIETDQLMDINTDNIFSIFETFGFDTGKKIEDFIKILIKKKVDNPNITMKELYEKTHINLIFTAVNLDKNKIEYLDHITYPDLPVYLAVRMSCSIPIYYNVVKYNEQHYIDGGILMNYPIEYFKNEINDTIGICTRDTASINKEINRLDNYITRILSLMFFQINHLSYELYRPNTVFIETPNTNFIDTHISLENKIFLIEEGYKKCIEWIDNYLGYEYFTEDKIKEITLKVKKVIDKEFYIINFQDWIDRLD
jgi:predicted acylesterase/phospholipase RssA